ncbi:MAG: ATP-binding protein [Patulibacter sp.]
MSEPSGLIGRRIQSLLAVRVAEESVIALHGPRSVGKSTVLRALAESRGVEVIDLDDLGTREAVVGNPSLLLAGHAPLCIDEYQRVPDVLDVIKSRLNREGGQPGLAVITGSTRQDALPRSAQALTGRLHVMTIWPLSQGELAGVHEHLLDALRRQPDEVAGRGGASTTARSEYVSRVCAGGFPLAVRRSAVARDRWFRDYIRQSIERDAAELAALRQRQALGALLAYCAGQTGQVLNIAKAADAVGVERRTAESYLRLLEDLFLVVRLPAWGKTLRARATSRPKVHVVDSGLAAYLQRLRPQRLEGLDPAALTEFGGLLETFVVGEIRKQASWIDEDVLLGHWRTSDGSEVDLVAEFGDGAVVAFEVKASERAVGADFAGLRHLRDVVGSRFAAGVVLTTGSRSYTYEDGLHVLPIDRLWQPN